MICKKHLHLLGLSIGVAITIPVVANSKLYEKSSKSIFEEDPYSDKQIIDVDAEPKLNMLDFSDVNKSKNKKTEEESEVYFSADELESDSTQKTITAIGNVEIIKENVSIQADKVLYNQETDTIEAFGNVVLLSADGNIVYANYVNLKEKMNDVVMSDIKVVLADKSHIAARKVKKFANNNKTMKNAVYSPCDLCTDKDPLWQLKASKITHDQENKDVIYNNAFLEIKGVPVMYAPYFSHPDPTVKRRSGFLMPNIGKSNYLGVYSALKYYFNISDQESLTVSPGYSWKVGGYVNSEYEKYFYNSRLKINAGYLNDNDHEFIDNNNRGHLFLKSKHNFHDNWTADIDFNYVSDTSYFRNMSMNKKDDAWLNSSFKLQNFDNRNYLSFESFYYKQISDALKKEDKPYVIPLATYETISESNDYGIYNKNIFNIASVYRRDNDSSYRGTMINSWVLPNTTSYGAKQKITASIKSDLYYIDNYDNYKKENYDGSTARIFPQLSYEWRLPFVRGTSSSRQIIEPIMVAVLSPNAGQKPSRIPNNDSQGARLDDTNILNTNRYAGYDINDTGSRISYGLNWSYYDDVIGRSSMLIAQSYQENKESYFTNNQHNKSDFSDIFGHLYANPHEYLDINYRFTLNKSSLDLEYSELSTYVGPSILNAYIAYIYLKDDNSSLVSQSNLGERKEIYVAIRSQITRDWSISFFNRTDLTKQGHALEYGASVIYEDECFTIQGNAKKDNSNDPKYKNNLEFTLDFYFKTLGGIKSN